MALRRAAQRFGVLKTRQAAEAALGYPLTWITEQSEIVKLAKNLRVQLQKEI